MPTTLAKMRLIVGRYLTPSLSSLLLLLLSGCVVFPMKKDPLPFGDEEVSKIVPGVTTRQEVIALLGKPYAERAGSSVALYGRSRRIAGAFFLAGAGDGFSDIESGHLLVLRYDANENVQEVDMFRRKPSKLNSEVCAPYGICIKPRFVTTVGRDSRLVGAYIYDTPDNDAAAKSFNVPPDQCAVFVYYDDYFLGDGDVVVGYPAGTAGPHIQIDESGYLFWRRDPGPLNVVGSVVLKTSNGWAPPNPGDEIDSSLEFDCTAGRVSYVHIKLRMGWAKNRLEISLDDSVDGADALQDRRLMLD